MTEMDDVAKRSVEVWLDAIEFAGREEEAWRGRADKVEEQYEASKDETRSRFNILYSNTQTMTSAIYNSEPTPDFRPRFDRENQTATQLAQVLERVVETSADLYGLDTTLEEVVHDVVLVGRGVVRVRYEPTETDGMVYQAVTCERVDWRDFRRGPGSRWSEVPWVAFQQHLTRAEIERLVIGQLQPGQEGYDERLALAQSVPLDSVTPGADKKYKGAEVPDAFKRGCVWEVWDKRERKLIFVAKGVDQVLREEDDPLQLEGFFPIPPPLYAVAKTRNLIPVEPYRLYQDQADELNDVSRRIQSLANVIRWRGIRLASITGLDDIDNAEDGTFLPAADDALQLMQAGGLDKMLWVMPTEKAVATLSALVQHRESIKQTIYEITGLADILRGASDAQETATAQQIKSQWGSLRIRKVQGDVQGLARNLFRLKVEIVANFFDEQNLSLMSGIQVTPDMMALLKQDVVRSYRIDIETDSTIRGDQTKAMEQMNLFLQGSAQYIQAMGPAVQSGLLPADVAVKIYSAFASAFRLGKQAEDALDALSKQATEAAQQPPQQQQDPAEDAKLRQIEAQTKAVEVKAQADIATSQQRMVEGQAKHGMEMQKMQFQASLPPVPPGMPQ